MHYLYPRCSFKHSKWWHHKLVTHRIFNTDLWAPYAISDLSSKFYGRQLNHPPPTRPSRASEDKSPSFDVQRQGQTLVRRGSGNPPGGVPIAPCMYSTTDDGKDSSSARASTVSAVSLFCTKNCAKSPTTFDDGVTCSHSLNILRTVVLCNSSKNTFSYLW